MIKKIKRIIYKIRTFGIGWPAAMTAAYIRFKVLHRPMKQFNIIAENIKGKYGLEIGGPTPFFNKGSFLPIYAIDQKIDICNLKKTSENVKYVCDATDLGQIKDNTYDFVLSSHTLEHLADPLTALSQWLRVLKQGGAIILVIPDKNRTFDHLRPTTPLEHLIKDNKNRTGKDDKTHLPDILEMTDLNIEDEHDENSFKEMVGRSHGDIHYHVFDKELIGKLLNYLMLKVLFVQDVMPHHIVCMAIKA